MVDRVGPKFSHSSSLGFWNWEGRPVGVWEGGGRDRSDNYLMAPGRPEFSAAALWWVPRLSPVQAPCSRWLVLRGSVTVAYGSVIHRIQFGAGRLVGGARFLAYAASRRRLQNGRWSSPHVCGISGDLQKRLYAAVCPQGDQLPPASLGDSLRPSGGSARNLSCCTSDLGPGAFSDLSLTILRAPCNWSLFPTTFWLSQK